MGSLTLLISQEKVNTGIKQDSFSLKPISKCYLSKKVLSKVLLQFWQLLVSLANILSRTRPMGLYCITQIFCRDWCLMIFQWTWRLTGRSSNFLDTFKWIPELFYISFNFKVVPIVNINSQNMQFIVGLKWKILLFKNLSRPYCTKKCLSH